MKTEHITVAASPAFKAFLLRLLTRQLRATAHPESS